MVTKQHFQQAADMVKAIKAGDWTDQPPSWAETIPEGEVDAGYSRVETVDDYTRAVQSAEFCILLFQAYNPRFNVDTFLRACGLK